MSNAIRQVDVHNVFYRLCKAMGKVCANKTGSTNTGAWHLDSSNPNGRQRLYVIQEYDNHRLGRCEPLGSRLRSGAELVDAMEFAMRCLETASQMQDA